MSSKGSPKVNFHFADARIKLPNRTLLKTFLIDLFKSEGVALESLDYIFCSDPYLRQINIQFLQHDYNTDIITFPLSEEGNPVIGEVYISLDTVKDNAETFMVSTQTELLRVIFHGALHLCGYGDKTKKEKTIMTNKEDEYLHKWSSSVPRGTSSQ
jgi:probable rRNA maturation factor